MKTIKLLVIAVTAFFVLASCQQEAVEIPQAVGELINVRLSASCDIRTKVTYTETNSDGIKLNPAWEAGDEVIGFDAEDNLYTFTVTNVNADSTAILEGMAPPSCTLHLVFLHGAASTDISEGSLSVNYEGQNGDKTMPAVMLADGEVKYGTGEFHFINAGAVIGVKAVNGVPSGTTISKITVCGRNLSGATVALDEDGKLALTATEVTDDSISTGDDFTAETVDENGTLSVPSLIAVPAGAIVSKIIVCADSEDYTCPLRIPATLTANEYSYINGQKFNLQKNLCSDPYHEHAIDLGLSVKWACMNVGAETPMDKGWYFKWSGINGYIPTNYNPETDDCIWVHASDPNILCDYDQWEHSDHENEFLGDISKFDARYDAATAIWGPNWRLPTLDEFQELYDATFWAWDETDKGYYVYLPADVPGASAGSVGTTEGLDKMAAKLFFPTTGQGNGVNKLVSGNFWGSYWANGISDWNYDADCFNFFPPYDGFTSFDFSSTPRRIGRAIRPVYEEFVPATAISLNSAELELLAGDDSQLIATLAPSNCSGSVLNWSSSNESVATVSKNGLVSAVGEGVATITVSWANGPDTKASCTVTVSRQATAHEYVEIEAYYDGTDKPARTIKWATCNIGAEEKKDFGWFFSWGNTTGYVFDGSKWVTAKGGVEYDRGFSIQNYFLTPGGSLTGDFAPDSGHDAARAHWGSSWRTPTIAELEGLVNATFWAWDETDKGYYVYLPADAHGASAGSFGTTEGLDKADAILFFPASGFGTGTRKDFYFSSRPYVCIWSSSFSFISGWEYIYSPTAMTLFITSDPLDIFGSNQCCDGMVIRPVSD